MASGLERSVPELFNVMMSILDLLDLASLLICSKSLQRRIEPMLYGSKDSYTKAMRWACLNGNLTIIRRAVAYYPSITAIETPHALTGKPTKVLTLYLAAKRSRAHAFRLLLELGAQAGGPDVEVDARQVSNLMQRLCTPANLPLLQAFLEAGLDAQVRPRHCQEVAWPLIPAIQSGASPALVQLLLERGANPNHVLQSIRSGPSAVTIRTLLDRGDNPNHLMQHRGFTHASPLSAAIAANSAPVFNMLLAHGADIDGTDLTTDSRAVLHIPVFAAAHAMARRHPHGRAMMQLCLDSGADINRPTCTTSRKCHYYTTPLHTYLEAIETWPHADADADSPTNGLAYLLDRGALINSTPQPLVRRRQSPAPHYRFCIAPTSVELLLDRWAVEQLAHPVFVATLELLVRRRPPGPSNTAHLLAKYDHHAEPGDANFAQALRGWHALLTALLAAEHDADATALLQALVLARATRCDQRGVHSFGAFARATADRLLAAGADINARIPAHPGMFTLLHAVCGDNRRVAKMHSYIHGARDRCQIVALLLSKGADPTALSWGETPVDMLAGMVDFRSEKCEEFVVDLLAILRGERASELVSLPIRTTGS